MKEIYCEKCHLVINNEDELVTSTVFLKVVPYHEKCFAQELKGCNTILVGNQPINGTYSNVFTFLFLPVLLILPFTPVFKTAWFVYLFVIIFYIHRGYSWFVYEQPFKKAK